MIHMLSNEVFFGEPVRSVAKHRLTKKSKNFIGVANGNKQIYGY
jgi:hypothetical protein